MARPFLINLNPVELKYSPFMISLDKCCGICNSVSDSKTKDVNVKAFNILIRINEA